MAGRGCRARWCRRMAPAATGTPGLQPQSVPQADRKQRVRPLPLPDAVRLGETPWTKPGPAEVVPDPAAVREVAAERGLGRPTTQCRRQGPRREAEAPGDLPRALGDLVQYTVDGGGPGSEAELPQQLRRRQLVPGGEMQQPSGDGLAGADRDGDRPAVDVVTAGNRPQPRRRGRGGRCGVRPCGRRIRRHCRWWSRRSTPG